MQTPIVTLTTDWGSDSFFAGMVKGALMRSLEGVQVIDVAHNLREHKVMSAAFVVRNACLGFPEGTVHLIDVAAQEPFVILRARGQYFLCADNGLPSLVFGPEAVEARKLPTRQGDMCNFAVYSLFVPTVVQLLHGKPFEEIGEVYPQLLARTQSGYMKRPDEDYYRLYVQFIDHYGNAYLGMTFDEFERLRAGRQFVLQFKEMKVTAFATTYFGNDAGARYAMRLTVSATGHLELAMCEHSLEKLSSVKLNDSVLLRFKG